MYKLSAMTHIRQIHCNFFALDPFLLHDFLQRKNAACVNGTIEITLEWIQHDIATSKMLRIHLMCVHGSYNKPAMMVLA